MGEPKIVVVDYHKGNLSSVVRGLARAGAAACTSDDPEQIRRADGLVIPGVGAFYDAIALTKTSFLAMEPSLMALLMRESSWNTMRPAPMLR